MNAAENKQALLRCIELYNKCTLEWVDLCFSKQLEWIELPTATNLQGRKGDFAFYRTSAEQLLKIFPDRKLHVLKSVAEHDCIVLEQEWHGTAAITMGNYNAGRVAKCRVASFFTLKHGLIIKQIDYCAPII
ncbi:MAG TPA: nuclear transport factor 2 family protein [Bacteroidota bacterium]|nr:nuclear transport factor 2 family protein [Bacteroidota bacterium]